MSRPPGDPLTAGPLILHFLSAVGEARLERIIRYMATSPLAFAPGTTKNILSKLTVAGEVERVGYGRYRGLGGKQGR